MQPGKHVGITFHQVHPESVEYWSETTDSWVDMRLHIIVKSNWRNEPERSRKSHVSASRNLSNGKFIRKLSIHVICNMIPPFELKTIEVPLPIWLFWSSQPMYSVCSPPWTLYQKTFDTFPTNSSWKPFGSISLTPKNILSTAHWARCEPVF